MARKNPGRTRFEPSQDDREKYARLMVKLTPSSSAYQAYRFPVDEFLSLVGPVLRGLQDQPLRDIRLRRSSLFSGLEYLIGYVDDDWLQGVAPECDAIASANVGNTGKDGQCLPVPPLVFLPDSKRRARSAAFRSVVEHEFVHVNQVLLGTFPGEPPGRRAADLYDQLLSRTIAEYEAGFLQLVLWPGSHNVPVEISLEHWCVLRGYSQALEHVLALTLAFDFPPREVERFLEELSSSLPGALQSIGATDEIASWFLPRLDNHLLIALRAVMTSFPEAKNHAALRAASRWVRDRLGIPSRHKIGTP